MHVYHNTYSGKTVLAVQFHDDQQYADIAMRLEDQEFPYYADVAVGMTRGEMHFKIWSETGHDLSYKATKGDYVVLYETPSGIVLPMVYSEDEFNRVFERVGF